MNDRIQELRKVHIALQDAHDGVKEALESAYKLAHRGNRADFDIAWARVETCLDDMLEKADDHLKLSAG
jgi:hypothetical protein